MEPGTKIAVISKSGEGVAVSKKPSDEASPKPPATETKTEKKPESTTPPPPAPEKSMAKTPSLPPPRTSASEPQLPPKERERRVSLFRLC